MNRRSFLGLAGSFIVAHTALKYIVPEKKPLTWEELRRQKLREHKLALERAFLFPTGRLSL